MRSLVVLCLCILAAVALSSSAPSHVRIASRTAAPPGWTRTTRLHASYRISFIVALKQRNLDQLERLFWAVSEPTSPQYQQFMQPEEITALIAPPKHDHDAVVSWLLRGGATIVKSYGDAIEATMTATDCEALFSTKLYLFRHQDGRRAARHWGHLSVPANIAALIDLVSGLSEFPVPHYGAQRTPAKPLDGQLSVIPETVQAAYQTPASYSPKSATSQGVIEFEDQYFSNDDLANFAQQVGATIANVSNNTIVGFNNPAAPGGESTLDIQYIAGVGVGITNWFWIEADNVWLYGFAVHFFSTSQVPYVISVSYGWSENDQCEDGIGSQECSQLGVDSTGYVQRVNVEFQKIGLRGVSILVASGDSGANGRTDEDCTGSTLLPDFPTGSPYITSVGATELHNAVYNLKTTPPACSGQGYACASGGQEAAVSYAQSNFASGGGFSNVAARPDYQSAAVSAYLSSGVALPPAGYYNTTSRGYPDVAAFGSGILIYQSGLQLTGGTSASTPIFAGVVALLNDYSLSATGKPLGFLNPLLYKMAADQPSAFTDITVGDNKCTESGCASTCQGFLAAPGWDPVTGLGSPVYPQMLAYLRKFNEARSASAALL